MDIIQPKVILCLGRATFAGVLRSLETERLPRMGVYHRFVESDENPVEVRMENGHTAYVFALAHCGAMGTLNRNGRKVQICRIRSKIGEKFARFCGKRENTINGKPPLWEAQSGGFAIGESGKNRHKKSGASPGIVEFIH